MYMPLSIQVGIVSFCMFVSAGLAYIASFVLFKLIGGMFVSQFFIVLYPNIFRGFLLLGEDSKEPENALRFLFSKSEASPEELGRDPTFLGADTMLGINQIIFDGYCAYLGWVVGSHITFLTDFIGKKPSSVIVAIVALALAWHFSGKLMSPARWREETKNANTLIANKIDNMFRLGLFSKLREEGRSAEDAAREVKKVFPRKTPEK